MSGNVKKINDLIEFSLAATKEKEPVIKEAKVSEIKGKSIFIDLDGDIQPAKVAFSCLVQPMAGDHILCSMSKNGCCVLSIIERPGTQNIKLTFPADVSIQMPAGDFSLLSGKSITLASGESLNCISDKAVHKSKEAVVDFEKITAKGKSLTASIKKVSMIGREINIIAENLMERVKRYIRHTQDYDQVKAGEMTRKSEGLLSINSVRTIMISKKDTIIDGEHIFTGL